MDSVEYTTEQRNAAISAIPHCVSLIYKHRETEAVLWKMIFSLAWKLAPTHHPAIVDGGLGYVTVKHSDHLRTIHNVDQLSMLRSCVADSSLFVPCARVVLIGDPGVAGQNHVHVVTKGGQWHSHQKMSNVVHHLIREGLLE